VSRKNRNYRAGELIRSLRSDLGLSPEALSYAIYEKKLGGVSARTIRRIEADGMVPRIRAQFAIATFFGRDVTSIWQPLPVRRARQKVAA
jgi:DNA-binding XRE family transcriptional regulator